MFGTEQFLTLHLPSYLRQAMPKMLSAPASSWTQLHKQFFQMIFNLFKATDSPKSLVWLLENLSTFKFEDALRDSGQSEQNKRTNTSEAVLQIFNCTTNLLMLVLKLDTQAENMKLSNLPTAKLPQLLLMLQKLRLSIEIANIFQNFRAIEFDEVALNTFDFCLSRKCHHSTYKLLKCTLSDPECDLSQSVKQEISKKINKLQPLADADIESKMEDKKKILNLQEKPALANKHHAPSVDSCGKTKFVNPKLIEQMKTKQISRTRTIYHMRKSIHHQKSKIGCESSTQISFSSSGLRPKIRKFSELEDNEGQSLLVRSTPRPKKQEFTCFISNRLNFSI